VLTIATAEAAWATCSIERQLVDLDAIPMRCSHSQLERLDRVLSQRIAFRQSLDLPLARKVLAERQCPSADELRAFFGAWKQLRRAGSGYTAKRYCLTPPAAYGIRFPHPDKPLDDAAAAHLAADIERMETVVIPTLLSKRAVAVAAMGGDPTPASHR
jgi:hypothetical protein